ncbi:hypothetical protein EGR_07024 [Echinococcus granulosus]|uniref:Uncharacterized protein n=1 Tax=Echinococcus granulosus TaxID=6210 RepID=W6UX61_ECHGR|nr:hypothetical protein EGR_07024 [Echinococcus granulosus]EUB58104.1 hypothetical protein EGR_07024 [Echinococcus granulosus]
MRKVLATVEVELKRIERSRLCSSTRLTECFQSVMQTPSLDLSLLTWTFTSVQYAPRHPVPTIYSEHTIFMRINLQQLTRTHPHFTLCHVLQLNARWIWKNTFTAQNAAQSIRRQRHYYNTCIHLTSSPPTCWLHSPPTHVCPAMRSRCQHEHNRRRACVSPAVPFILAIATCVCAYAFVEVDVSKTC